jgi:hypothetical protein
MDKQPISYRFKGIEIISSSMAVMPAEGSTGNFIFDINVEMRVQANISAVMPFVRVSIKDNQTPAAQMVVACVFEVVDFNEHIKMNQQGQYEVPIEFQNFLIPIAISTTRGVVFSEFKGTWLHFAIMPIVPLQQLQDGKKAAKKVKERQR